MWSPPGTSSTCSQRSQATVPSMREVVVQAPVKVLEPVGQIAAGEPQRDVILTSGEDVDAEPASLPDAIDHAAAVVEGEEHHGRIDGQ